MITAAASANAHELPVHAVTACERRSSFWPREDRGRNGRGNITRMIRCFRAMGVLLQAFYWDCPREAGVEHGWWRHVTARLDGLRDAGFTALWLPPCSKAFSTKSMGYDPFDYFDLGEFDQRGGVETWFGSKADLVALVGAAHQHGMQVYADAVYNHMSGGEKEHNPDFGSEGWTRFRPASGR